MMLRKNVRGQKWIALGVLAAGLSLIVLDGTIVGVALPRIIESLGLTLTSAQWVTSLYSVVFAAFLLTFGKLGDIYGRRRIFLTGVTIFILGSLLAALAGTASLLIAARAVQGLGGSMVLPTTLSIVNATFRGKDRAIAFGVWGAVMAGMAAIGPLLGGWLTTAFTWRYIFLVNIPLGLVIIALGLAFVPASPDGEAVKMPRDLLGFVLSAAGSGTIVYGLIENSARLLVLVGIVLLAIFAWWESRRPDTALLDMRLFRLPTFAWGNLTAGAVATGEFAMIFILPLYLVNVRELTIMQAGWVLAAMAIGALVAGGSARHLAAALGAARAVILGLALEVAGIAAAVVVVHGERATGWLTLALVVYGIGLGIASAQLTSLVLADVSPSQSGIGSATQSTVRQFGSALGAAVSGTVLAARLNATLPPNTAGPVVSSAGGAIHTLPGADAIATAFAHAASTSILVALVFLVLGLVGSIRVWQVSRKHEPAREAVAVG
ncbi:MAG: MFS transporter [Corynebacterium glucuronolyticum]|nr:MFS transporter [Mycobacteriaceae bacterium]MDY5834047.1 MFS transporter [Corynebacterium glucuronolyticum]